MIQIFICVLHIFISRILNHHKHTLIILKFSLSEVGLVRRFMAYGLRLCNTYLIRLEAQTVRSVRYSAIRLEIAIFFCFFNRQYYIFWNDKLYANFCMLVILAGIQYIAWLVPNGIALFFKISIVGRIRGIGFNGIATRNHTFPFPAGGH